MLKDLELVGTPARYGSLYSGHRDGKYLYLTPELVSDILSVVDNISELITDLVSTKEWVINQLCKIVSLKRTTDECCVLKTYVYCDGYVYDMYAIDIRTDAKGLAVRLYEKGSLQGVIFRAEWRISKPQAEETRYGSLQAWARDQD